MNTPITAMKFGGTSVATAERWATILSRLNVELKAGNKPLLVCSALSGVTNMLEATIAACADGNVPEEQLVSMRRKHDELAQSLGVVPDDRFEHEWSELVRTTQQCAMERAGSPETQARLLASGERLSTSIGAAWLQSVGVNAAWKDVTDILEVHDSAANATDPASHYLSSAADWTYSQEHASAFRADSADVWITQGFTARDRDGAVVLLGRGGSDTSAACLAARLGAKELQIWTDVPGLFTSNPRDIRDVRMLKFASYDEAECLAAMGAKVLHPRCIGPVRDAEIPLRICWTEHPDMEGTIIEPERDIPTDGFKAVTSRSDVSLIVMRRPASWQPVGFMVDVAKRFESFGLSMDLISTSPSEIRATVDLSASPGFELIESDLVDELHKVCNEVEVYHDVACVSLVGSRVSSEIERIGATLSALGEGPVRMVSYAANDAHISYVVAEEFEDELVALAHTALFEQRGICEVFGPAWHDLVASPPVSTPDDIAVEATPA